MITRSLAALALKDSPHWVEFYVHGVVRGVTVSYTRTVRFKEAPVLYSEQHSYRAAQANVLRRAKVENDLHPCVASRLLTCSPHDWSDSVDVVSSTAYATAA